jgi:hypothetical protein
MAQAAIDELVARFLERCPQAAVLAHQMKEATGTRFKDWIDSIFIPHADTELRTRLRELGWERDKDAEVSCGLRHVLRHHGALFPPVVTMDGDFLNIAIKAERVGDFMAAHRVFAGRNVGGRPGARTRWAMAFSGERAELWAIERHGYTGFGDTGDRPRDINRAERWLEKLRTRRRDFGVGPEADAKAFAHLDKILDAAIEQIGQWWTADLFFQAERGYWMSRNRAARVQFARQQALGLGWANHDHHTYRCSRRNFARTIGVFEKLGFYCREKFYAGAEAGWGAQVLEHPIGVTIFADVDMQPEELSGDFAHEGFATDAGGRLGTVGLWVELHGEAILQAGMHHLECQFDWHALKAQLQREAGIGMMDPFTTFPFLRQAFTEGEQWAVQPARVQALLSAAQISPAEADRFRAEGARGSHLENLERNDGYKGFNQQGVSDIIARTDARRG